MKKPDEIKKELAEAIEEASWVVEGGDAHDLIEAVEKAHASMADALDYIQQLEEACQNFVNVTHELAEQVPKWISVEERLPEVSDVVLVIANGKPREHITLHNAYLIASYWGEEGWIADGFEGWDKLDVSYWMELPGGPKEG